jgi:hypothetical protein
MWKNQTWVFGRKDFSADDSQHSRERKSGRLDLLLFSNILLFSYLSLLTTLEIRNENFDILIQFFVDLRVLYKLMKL